MNHDYGPDSLPLLTVFTDASYCPRTGAAGWAGWAKRSDMEPWFHSQPFKSQMPGAAECEAAAMANAARLLMRKGYAGGNQHVLMQTDCLAVIAAVGKFCQTYSAVFNDYIGPLLELKEKVRCLELRHVHGHFKHGNRERRNHVNDRCDRAARAAMEVMRNGISN